MTLDLDELRLFVHRELADHARATTVAEVAAWAGVADLLRPLRDTHVRANLEQSLVDAAQISRPVIKQSNHDTIKS